jgi:RNA polymerase sigma factor for flagellar operon FliA
MDKRQEEFQLVEMTMTLAQTRQEHFGKDSHLLRNQIISEYLPYVKRIVNRIAVHLPATIEVDDLVNVGVIGLIQAIERYDPTRDNKFITYAVFRIKGAVLSELRSRDFLGRTTRRKIRDLEKAYLKLEQKLGREVSDEEVAKEMNMDLEQFYKVKRMSSISFVSFEELGYTSRSDSSSVPSSLSSGDADDALSLTAMKELKATIAKNIDLLPEKEKLVISLYYSEEMTMKEIGQVLNITESRVSQIHAQAIIHLRGKMRRDGMLED